MNLETFGTKVSLCGVKRHEKARINRLNLEIEAKTMAKKGA